MGKEKTLSIKQSVNTALKPIIEDGVELYPVYTQVIYDANNTRFKLHILDRDIYVDKAKGLNDTRFTDFKNEINRQENQIENITRYEEELLGKDFNLRGLGKRIPIYNLGIEKIYGGYIHDELNEYLQTKLTYKEYIEKVDNLSFEEKTNFVLDNMTEGKRFEDASYLIKGGIVGYRIFKDLNNAEVNKRIMTCYSWIFDGGKTAIHKAIKNVQLPELDADSMVNSIDGIILTTIKSINGKPRKKE